MKRAITLTFAVAVLAVLTAAQSKPNFAGTWKLNAGESDFGPLAGATPASLIYTLTLEGSALHFKQDRLARPEGKMASFELNLKIDGPKVTRSNGDKWSVQQKSTSLIFIVDTGSAKPQVQTWSLSADGKKLTDLTQLTQPNGNPGAQIRRVFDRQ